MLRIRRFSVLLLCTVTFFLSGLLVTTAPSASQTDSSPFEQVWQTVNDNFYDPNFNGVDWLAAKAQYKPLADAAQSETERAQVINRMLSALQTSHTHFYTPEDKAYYQLLGIFLPLLPDLQPQIETHLPDGKPQYSGIGIFTKQTATGTFVEAVLDGSPAEGAGLMRGDKLLSVDGQPFHPIGSFLEKVGQPTSILVERSPNVQEEIVVVPEMLDTTEMFMDAMKASVDVVERAGQKVGYVHLWSYAGEKFHKQLKNELLYGQLKDVDSFTLDLRDGWGGASASYLNFYTPQNIAITGTARNRPPSTASSAWSKPVVMLVNEGSRSGKEILAYGFRKHGIGPIVGTKTAGAVVQGNLYVMNDGSILYLAIADIQVDGDVRIEGAGIEPTIEVAAPLAYAQGADPQKEAAIEVAFDEIR
ncbi:peptidase, S41 family [Synechococcus sp. PCC 7335]|uniref:S41 family peptidase n=1 Tax=Synechococcus sp. (strain ATCC 29403 / PCC 7335) TaxID=91464 RepID=UPI00017ED2A5|nr:S41 family peptidase [Synechococcus sp. PCC 7335]EDX83248.1 peptidase, S41 family [Synechococcus sp. PCC 7335]